MRELRNILTHFAAATEPMALATIVGTRGSSYRRDGTRMLVMADGRTAGTLSGGCIEEEVAERARAVLPGGRADLFTIDTLQRFGCPGSLEILLERILPGNAFLTDLGQCFSQRRAAEVVVQMEEPMGSFPLAKADVARQSFRQTILPPVRLVLVGGGTDSDALLQFSQVLGWDAAVIEPSEIADLQPDERTALVIKNHHFGRDIAGLSQGLARPFGYIGLLSSQQRKRHLVNLLHSEGFLPLDYNFDTFHGPSGLDLGADSPEEVALSIIAEIQAVMTGHAGGFLRDREEPIHQTRCLAAAR